MKYKIPCPACGQSISAWRMMVTPTHINPFRLKCPKCKAKVRVRLKGWALSGWIIVMIIVGILAFSSGCLYASKQIAGITAFAMVAGVIIIGSVGGDLVICNKATLIVAKSSHEVA